MWNVIAIGLSLLGQLFNWLAHKNDAKDAVAQVQAKENQDVLDDLKKADPNSADRNSVDVIAKLRSFDRTD